MTGVVPAVIDAVSVTRRFGDHVAVEDLSLSIPEGRVHALLGPNGAGKTTLLRVLAGVVAPTAGSVTILGEDAARNLRDVRARIGFVPSGDRSFYLRISGLENLVFFGRLHGLSRRAAAARAAALMTEVELGEALHKRVGEYSHGMQKRLAVARALLHDPPVLLVDEATHDLDPAGAVRVRELVAALAARGTAVLWATQRLDEIRDFAHRVTLLHRARVCFEGSVPELVAHAEAQAYLLHLRNGSESGAALADRLAPVLAGTATIEAAGDDQHYTLVLERTTTLGEALTAVMAAGVEVVGCSETRSRIEAGFLRVTSDAS